MLAINSHDPHRLDCSGDPQAMSMQSATKSITSHGPQRIVILCDGTWEARDPVDASGALTSPTRPKRFTNVALLAQCIEPTGLLRGDQTDAAPGPRTKESSKTSGFESTRQIVYYLDGVGTSPSIIANLYNGATGGTLGLKVREAYHFLVDNWTEGDEILIFGFSRGAYTARALAAFINFGGIMTKTEAAQSLTEIWTAYQRRDPSKPKTVDKAETTFYHKLGRWPSGSAMRAARGNVETANRQLGPDELTPADEEQASNLAGLAHRYPRVYPPTIEVVGVWDTVGALGVPGSFLPPALTKMYGFFDPMLAPNVRNAFHALGLEEDRKDFLPTLWYLPDPNTEVQSDQERRKGQVLRQTWFQGCHTDVGGGQYWCGLSDITLAWMIAQVTDVGKGQPPLLSVDLDSVKALQDRRRAWAKQQEHPSRLCIEFQFTRNVATWNIPQSLLTKAIWKGAIKQSITHESIHYSVIAGKKYELRTSPQFKTALKFRKEIIAQMWTAAQDPGTLLPTEKKLMWSTKPERVADKEETSGRDRNSSCGTKSGVSIYDASATDTYKNPSDLSNMSSIDGRTSFYDPNLPPTRPPGMPKALWRLIDFVGWIPPKTIAGIVNLGPRPTRNLKPGLLLDAVGAIEERTAGQGMIE